MASSFPGVVTNKKKENPNDGQINQNSKWRVIITYMLQVQ